MSDDHGPAAATPHKQLIAELNDSTIPKTEREHAAARELRHVREEISDCRRKLEDYTNFDEVIAVSCRLEELEKRLGATQ